jgi:teichuronic acid biosynthesis glycosyltransferase TuaG
MSELALTFSVVIPVYNGEQFIAKAIESCLKQTLLPNEIIIIDDAGNDRTEEIVKNIQSDLIIYIKNDQNRGPSFSRNAGMKMARSSWILFLDADDLFHSRKIEIINACLLNNSNIKAIGHAFSIKKGSETSIKNFEKTKMPKPVTVFQILLRNRMVTPSLCVAATNHILFDEEIKYTEDHDFILRTAEEFGIWYVDIPLCSIHRRSLTTGGQSGNKWKMRKGEMKMYVKYCRRNNRYLLLPFLIVFSFCKHIKNEFAFGKQS